MGIGTGSAALIGGLGAAGSIGSSLIGSSAAKAAAKAQMDAANKAAGLQGQASNSALNYQNGIYNQTEQNLAPWLQSGGGALNNLSYLLGVRPNSSIGGFAAPAQGLNLNQTPGASPALGTSSINGQAPSLNGGPSLPSVPRAGVASAVPGASGLSLSGGPSLATPQAGAALGIQGGGINQQQPALNGGAPQGGFGSLTQGYGQTFQAPQLNESTDPGYQARLNLGTDAIQRSAAARGGVLTGGTGKALNQFAQDYASNEYNNVYGRALQGFNTNYNVWNNDNNNIYSRLMGLSGAGQNAVNSLGTFGQESANNVTGNLLGTGAQIGQDYGNAGAANASGIYNSGAAWQGGINGITGNLSQLMMLKQLGLGGGGGNYATNSGGALPTGWA